MCGTICGHLECMCPHFEEAASGRPQVHPSRRRMVRSHGTPGQKAPSCSGYWWRSGCELAQLNPSRRAVASLAMLPARVYGLVSRSMSCDPDDVGPSEATVRSAEGDLVKAGWSMSPVLPPQFDARYGRHPLIAVRFDTHKCRQSLGLTAVGLPLSEKRRQSCGSCSDYWRLQPSVRLSSQVPARRPPR